MVKLRRVYEALPQSELTRKCKEVVRDILGVIPFPYGEDSILFKATYFRFQPYQMDIVTGEDVKITFNGESLVLFINKNCDPNGGWDQVMVEPVTPENPFAKAIIKVLECVKEETQKNGREWCRIGNYKTLLIKSPYIDRLKAFCIQNPDLKIPLVASKQLTDAPDTPEVVKTLSILKGEELPEVKVNKINSEIPDGVKPNIVRDVKPMTDRQKKNQLNKLLDKGIGGEKDKPKPVNPRIRKVR